MATILEFQRSGIAPRDATSNSGEAAQAGAEIIIFPGVRYERWEDTPPGEDAGIGLDDDDVLDASPKTRRRATASGRSATAARKKPRAERKRDILEIPD